MNKTTLLSVGVIGAGIGASHVAGYRAHPHRYLVAAVCDLDIARAREVAGEETGTRAVTDMADLLADPEIDIIDVSLPPHLHFSATIAALDAGKHVICEKPMAPTVADCNEMIKACNDNKVQLSIGYRMHYEPNTQEIMRLAKDKDFGNIRQISTGAGFNMNFFDSWKSKKELNC